MRKSIHAEHGIGFRLFIYAWMSQITSFSLNKNRCNLPKIEKQMEDYNKINRLKTKIA